jgi:hypothetical protein
MTIVNLANAKGSSEGKTVSGATHFGLRGHNVQIADFLQGFLKFD